MDAAQRRLFQQRPSARNSGPQITGTIRQRVPVRPHHHESGWLYQRAIRKRVKRRQVLFNEVQRPDGDDARVGGAERLSQAGYLSGAQKEKPRTGTTHRVDLSPNFKG